MVKNQSSFILLVLILFISGIAQSQLSGSKDISPVICLSWEEVRLYRIINDHRARHRLPEIPLSASLTHVAQVHAKDLAENYVYDELCNLHSWSDKGQWSPCCYSSDHKRSDCMWNKPEELTTFNGQGYEIAYWNNREYEHLDELADDALHAWRKSRGHHNVILNRSKWKEVRWLAMGVGIYEGFVLVWFSDEADPLPAPGICLD